MINRNLSVVLFFLYVILFISLIFSFRAISSVSTGIILLTGIAKNKIEQGKFFNKSILNILFLSCILFFLIQFAGLLYTENIQEGWNNLRIKTGLIVLPMALTCCDFINEQNRKNLLTAYCFILFVAILYCLGFAAWNFQTDHDSSVFFYHDLVKHVLQHAIQFSILVVIGLMHLLESWKRNEPVGNKKISIVLFLFFSGFLFLLSSKLFIILYLVYLFYFSFSFLRKKDRNLKKIIFFFIIVVSVIGFIFITNNPVSKRFSNVIHGDLALVDQKKFSPADSFTGLQFRLLEWRFIPEILSENKTWLKGVGPGDGQSYLDKKYISEKMYVGEPVRGDTGFLGYNTHNEFLEALLQSGIMGLVAFVIICFSLIRMAWQRKKAELSFITILLLAYCFTDSIFEMQYSIIIFIFFPLFFYSEPSNKKIGNARAI